MIEAGEHLAAFEAGITEAERLLMAGTAPDAALVNRLFRAVHTLKGMAGMLGFSATVTLAHETEEVLDGARSGRTPLAMATLDVLADVAGGLGRLLERVAAEGREDGVDVLPIQGRLLALARGEAGAGAPLDLLERLGPQDQVDALVEVARGQKLFNLDFAGGEPGAAPEGVRLLGAWDGRGKALAPADAAAQRPWHLLVLAPAEAEAGWLELAMGGSASPAPLPWQAPEEPVIVMPPPEEAARRRAEAVPATAGSSTRIETQRLDRLGELAGQLAADQTALLALIGQLQDRPAALADLARQAQERTQALVQLLAAARRVTAAALFGRFARPVRELARATGKAVRLEIRGGEVLLERDLAERLVEPLMHLLRNAVDHGIEPPADRRAAHKPPQGVITLEARAEGAGLLIAVADDGRGIDRGKVLAEARASGLVTEAAALDEAAIDQLVFTPGLSTAADLTELSGRGVGMDAVRESLSRLGGSITLESRQGQGTRCVLRFGEA